MEITLQRKNNALHFEGMTPEGLRTEFDSSALTGDAAVAPSPMQTVLMSIATCSSIDIVMILKKMRQRLDDIKVDVRSERAETAPRVFKSIHLHYRLFGKVGEKQAHKAIRLSMEQYCSVSLMLKGNVDITWSFEVTDSEE